MKNVMGMLREVYEKGISTASGFLKKTSLSARRNRDRVIEVIANPPQDKKKRYRTLLAVISVVCIIDYIAIAKMTDNNIFDIYPAIPVLDTRESIDIFVADLDAKSILKEQRDVQLPDDNENIVRKLVKLVAEGSEFENTRAIVPIDIIIRHVWFYDNVCIIDFELGTIEGHVPYIEDSFKAFNNALEQTISRNIEGITRVVLLEHGIYGKNMW